MLKKCMEFLRLKKRGDPPPIVVAFGDDDFLRQEACRTVRDWVVGPDPDDFTYAEHDGDVAKARDVLDELFTPPFLGERRLAYVESADKFVTNFREALFDYAQSPSSTGVLLLEVRTWPANTKLAKHVEKEGLAVDCKGPQAWHAGGWCCQWAEERYEKKMSKTTGDWLVELVGVHLGQLDQEMQKLAAYVGDRPEIDLDAVNKLVASARAESVFKLLDLTLEGNPGLAIEHLDRQLLAGEAPVGILAMLTAQLRKLTRAARETQSGKTMHDALKEAGVPPFAIDKGVAQLRHFGRDRMNRMYRRLLKADLDLKGESALDPRTIVERLLIELATPAGK